jgi:type I restriction enzyme S subunit
MVIPADWRKVRLGECLTIMHGKNQSQIVDPEGRYPILATGGVIGRTNSYLSNKPSVLIGRKGTIDRPQYMDTPFWTVDTLFYSEVKSGISAKFLFYKFLMVDWKKYNEASGVPSLNASTIENVEMVMPPLREQEVIAEALSDADAAIESLDALIVKKRDVKQATMQQLLTGRTRLPGFTADWKEVRLGDLGSTFGGLTGKSSKDFADGNSSFVTFMNVMSNVVLNNQGTEKVRIGNGERQSQLLEGDVIFNGSSETPEEVGFGSAVPNELSGLYLNSFCFGFRRKDTKSLDPKFFAYLTRSPLGRDIIRPMAQGSTRYNIAKTNLLNGRFPLPPLKEQEAIAEALSVMDEELKALTEQVSKMRMVKEGMMQDLLSGKVRLV